MHAVVARVTLNDQEAAQTTLENQVVPGVRQAPGFVGGYWTKKDATGLALILFDSEENARRMSEQLPSLAAQLGDAVTFQDAEIREVVASA